MEMSSSPGAIGGKALADIGGKVDKLGESSATVRDSKVTEHFDIKSTTGSALSTGHLAVIWAKLGPFWRSDNLRTREGLGSVRWRDPLSLGEVEVCHLSLKPKVVMQCNPRSSRRGNEQIRLKRSESRVCACDTRRDLRVGDNPHSWTKDPGIKAPPTHLSSFNSLMWPKW